MKKVMLSLVMGFALVVSISSCDKCSSCELNGVSTGEYCEGGAAQDAFESACEAAGGTVK